MTNKKDDDMSDDIETTEAVRARIKLYEDSHQKSQGSWGSLSHHDGDIATTLEDWALPIAIERDRLAARVEQLEQAILNMEEPNAWVQFGERYLACPFCGDVTADNVAVPHDTGCPWWELVPASGGGE